MSLTAREKSHPSLLQRFCFCSLCRCTLVKVSDERHTFSFRRYKRQNLQANVLVADQVPYVYFLVRPRFGCTHSTTLQRQLPDMNESPIPKQVCIPTSFQLHDSYS